MKDRAMAVGVDIGGTNVKLGLVDNHGRLISRQSLPLPRNGSDIAELKAIGTHIGQFIGDSGKSTEIVGIGVASPGFLDVQDGVVLQAVNLGWSQLRLVEQLQQQLGFPIRLQSDAVAGANGERRYGAGIGLQHFLYVCLGTGVGASLYDGASFYKGARGAAINLGHISVIHDGAPCRCGNKGCLEMYVSASAIANRAGMEAARVWEAANSGNVWANHIFEEAGELLGIAIVNCIQLFGVEHVVIGGGLSQAGKYLLEPMNQVIQNRFNPEETFQVSVVSSSIPNTAGVLGAASLFLKEDDYAGG